MQLYILLFIHLLSRGRLPGDCEEEVLDLVQDEPSYGSYCYSVQVRMKHIFGSVSGSYTSWNTGQLRVY